MYKKYILLDSKYRDNYDNTTSTNFRYYLKKSITIKSYLKMKYLLIPRSNYLINNKNNTFNIIINNINYSITLNIQTYTPEGLCDFINKSIANYSIKNFLVTYDITTYKLLFSYTTNFQIDLTKSNFHKLLSLKKQIYNSSNNVFLSNPINFNSPQYININLSNIPNDIMASSNNSYSNNFIVPLVVCNFNEILIYNDVNYGIQMNLNNTTLNYLDVVIYDDYYELFQNNGYDWFCIFEYDSDE